MEVKQTKLVWNKSNRECHFFKLTINFFTIIYEKFNNFSYIIVKKQTARASRNLPKKLVFIIFVHTQYWHCSYSHLDTEWYTTLCPLTEERELKILLTGFQNLIFGVKSRNVSETRRSTAIKNTASLSKWKKS